MWRNSSKLVWSEKKKKEIWESGMEWHLSYSQTHNQSPHIYSFSRWNMGRRSMRAKPFGTQGEKATFAVSFRPSLDAPQIHQTLPINHSADREGTGYESEFFYSKISWCKRNTQRTDGNCCLSPGYFDSPAFLNWKPFPLDLLTIFQSFSVKYLNPLSPNIKMHILLTDLHTFLIELVKRICLNIKTSYPQWSLPLFLLLACSNK